MKANKVWLVVVWLIVVAVCWAVMVAPEYLTRGKYVRTAWWSVVTAILLVAVGLILTRKLVGGIAMKISIAELLVVGLMIIAIWYVMVGSVGMTGNIGAKRFVADWNYVGKWILVILLVGAGAIFTIRAVKSRKAEG